MNSDTVKSNELEGLLAILDDSGICYNTNDYSEELIFDSLQFVSIFVSIEDNYGIYIPDEYLAHDKLNSIEKILTAILEIKGGPSI